MSEPDYPIVRICPNMKLFKNLDKRNPNVQSRTQSKFKFRHDRLSKFYIRIKILQPYPVFSGSKKNQVSESNGLLPAFHYINRLLPIQSPVKDMGELHLFLEVQVVQTSYHLFLS